MVVAVINMTSVVLILIIERTRMIGVLAALGMSSGKISSVFLWNVGILIFVGALVGNVLGLGLLGLQYKFHFLSLNPKDYFISYVPVTWVWMSYLWVNLGVIFICTLCMVLPTYWVSRISPVKAIRFD